VQVLMSALQELPTEISTDPLDLNPNMNAIRADFFNSEASTQVGETKPPPSVISLALSLVPCHHPAKRGSTKTRSGQTQGKLKEQDGVSGGLRSG
jgi:hypothetical protein